MKQISLDAAIEILKREGIDSETIAAFTSYHKENPRVWYHFSRLAYRLMTQNRYYGAKFIMERVRWEIDDENFRAGKRHKFKINDHWTAYYARIFLIFQPRYAKAFKRRKLKGVTSVRQVRDPFRRAA
jgi:hypothetical protein